ncbi:MAG: hypothetical protein PHU81_07480 [Acidobacteriota bacterium]|nr:hypothetical protein [Acidobacteriota bacterium]
MLKGYIKGLEDRVDIEVILGISQTCLFARLRLRCVVESKAAGW